MLYCNGIAAKAQAHHRYAARRLLLGLVRYQAVGRISILEEIFKTLFQQLIEHFCFRTYQVIARTIFIFFHHTFQMLYKQ